MRRPRPPAEEEEDAVVVGAGEEGEATDETAQTRAEAATEITASTVEMLIKMVAHYRSHPEEVATVEEDDVNSRREVPAVAMAAPLDAATVVVGEGGQHPINPLSRLKNKFER